jgi:uncharacterized protein
MTILTLNGKAEIKNGGRYIGQLCKHWAHKLDVRLDNDAARVVFPKETDDPNYPEDAIAIFRATESRIDVHLTAFTPTQLEALCGVIDDHLDRFAFREGGLRLSWEPA